VKLAIGPAMAAISFPEVCQHSNVDEIWDAQQRAHLQRAVCQIVDN
jgi:hypothetical protein